MLTTLVEKIADLWNAPDEWIAAERAAMLPADPACLPTPGALFRQRLLEVARQRQRAEDPMVAGLMTLKWQSGRLNVFGSHYRDMRALTTLVTHMVLEQMAGPPDAFIHHDADSYLICFASAHRQVCSLRTTMIGQAIEAALVKQMPALEGQLRLEAVVSSFDPFDVVARNADPVIGLVELLCKHRDERIAGPVMPGLFGKPTLAAHRG